MLKLKSHTIYKWEDFEHCYSIKNAPEDTDLCFCVYNNGEKEYERTLKKEDGNIFCIEIPSSITENLDAWEYEYRIMTEWKRKRALANWSLTIS